MAHAENFSALYRALLERFDWTHDEIAEKIDRRGGDCILIPLGRLHSGLEPVKHLFLGRVIWLIFVVGPDMPDSKLSVAAVEMCPAMNG